MSNPGTGSEVDFRRDVLFFQRAYGRVRICMKSHQTWIPYTWKPFTHLYRDVQCERKCVLKSCQRKGIRAWHNVKCAATNTIRPLRCSWLGGRMCSTALNAPSPLLPLLASTV